MVNRLDKVNYQNEIIYVHHVTEHDIWLYGVSTQKKRTTCLDEPVRPNEIQRLERCTDFSDWLSGKVGIDHLWSEDKKILSDLCMENKIDISDAETDCCYKQLWFINGNKLETVQTIFEAEGIKKIYKDMVEYISCHERTF